jgi:2-(1,2-epoxy-1,2-dihydrophenyl)acetyl-CoA isomerase
MRTFWLKIVRYCPAPPMIGLELETVDLKISDRVAWITLNRPDALNAWIRRLGDDMLTALEHAASDADVRAIVFTGAGRAFSSGADLKAGGEPGPNGGLDVQGQLRDSYNPLMLRLRAVPKPVIAAVNGPAVGIGCSLALACDLIVAAESAYFLLAFVNIGLTLDGGASLSLPARVGQARAFEMAMLGERIPAARALEWGMVNRVVADQEFDGAVSELASRLAAGPPGSYAAIKHSLNQRMYDGFADALELEAALQQQRAESKDFMEGALSFLQKRKPEFTGD